MYQFGRNSSETWRDISLANGKPLVQPQRRLLLGGSVSVWTGDCKCRELEPRLAFQQGSSSRCADAKHGCLFPFVQDGVAHRWLFYGEECPGEALHAITPDEHICNVPCTKGDCECGNTSMYYPKAQWMSAHTAAADAAFAESSSRWTWPVGAAAAGSFWRWQPTIAPAELARRLRGVTAYMAARGVAVCPFDAEGCPGGCTYTHFCGVSYKHGLST